MRQHGLNSRRGGATAPCGAARSGRTRGAVPSRGARFGAAFIEVTAERVRLEAVQARERWHRGLPLGPLDGLPVTWKDLFDVRGTRTTAGSRTRLSVPHAVADAPLVGRAARAGLILVGKTNLSEFAFSGLGINTSFGTPDGPPDPNGTRRVPGGSSSGAATSVRLGAALVGMGTDTAGSVRIPAAFQGLVGFRPSVGRYPLQGMFPLARSFDTAGPIARTVEDCIVVDEVLTGRGVSRPPARLDGAVIVVDEPLMGLAEDWIRLGMTARLNDLGRAGARIILESVPILREVEETLDTLGWLGAVEALAVHVAALETATRELIDPRIVDRLTRAATVRPDVVSELYRRREEFTRRATSYFRSSFLLYPAVGFAAPEFERLLEDDACFATTNLAVLRATMLTSFLGMPGVSMPVAAARNKLPAGMLLSAAPEADENLLALARAIEIPYGR